MPGVTQVPGTPTCSDEMEFSKEEKWMFYMERAEAKMFGKKRPKSEGRKATLATSLGRAEFQMLFLSLSLSLSLLAPADRTGMGHAGSATTLIGFTFHSHHTADV